MTDFRVRDLYDQVLYTDLLEEYYRGSGFANFGYREKKGVDAMQACHCLMEKLLEFLPGSVDCILDVACGKGATTRFLRDKFPAARITATNISHKQLLSARSRVPDSWLVLVDAGNMGFRDACFDALICVEAAFHFKTRERFFREAWRILKPGGVLILSDVLFLEGAEKGMRSFHEDNFLPDLDSYSELGRRCGFKAIQVVDATKQCWEEHFWCAIRFMHNKFLHRQIDRQTLLAGLEKTYRIGEVLHRYLLAGMMKDKV